MVDILKNAEDSLGSAAKSIEDQFKNITNLADTPKVEEEKVEDTEEKKVEDTEEIIQKNAADAEKVLAEEKTQAEETERLAEEVETERLAQETKRLAEEAEKERLAAEEAKIETPVNTNTDMLKYKDHIDMLSRTLGDLATAFDATRKEIVLVANQLNKISSDTVGGRTRGKRRKTRSKRQKRTRRF
jgi:molecular chaperone GrpE (heat shock protein)